MKKYSVILACALLLSSCSIGGLILSPVSTSTPAPTPTKTYTPIPSATPVTPTLTFTLTPTLSGIKSATPFQTETATPTYGFTPLAFITPDTATPTIQMDGFVAVLVSRTEFYRGTKCQPNSVKFTIQVADPNAAAYVNLSLRFKSKTTDAKSAWTSFTVQPFGAGTFIREVFSEELKADTLFRNPWVEYQMIAVDVNAREIGRTAIFKESLTMLECVPTPTPPATGVKP